MRVALTFDDGPSKWTPPLLDILDKEDVKATFFVCGSSVTTANGRILKRAHKAGHEVGNHTMTHPNLDRSTKRAVLEELADCSALLYEVLGVAPKVYRPPYLKDSMVAQAVGEALGMVSVGADVIGYDWQESNSLNIATSMRGDTFDGAVLLLHDGRPPGQPPYAEGGSLDSRSHSLEAVMLLVPELKKRGYEFVTCSELLLVSA